MFLFSADSFSGSPPDPAYIEPRRPQGAFASAQKCISDVAAAKLASLTEFLASANPGEAPIATLLSDMELCAALKEIDPNILLLLNQKALSNKALSIILPHCPALKSLNLLGFHQITEIGLACIANLDNLTALNLSATQVKNLSPLIKKPLLQLRTVNFFQTSIDFNSLIEFLKCHKISHLTPPTNPPKGFFESFPAEHLVEIMLHIDSSTDSVSLEEILSFAKRAQLLQKVHAWYQRTLSDSEVLELVCLGKNFHKDVTIVTEYCTFSVMPNFKAHCAQQV